MAVLMMEVARMMAVLSLVLSTVLPQHTTL